MLQIGDKYHLKLAEFCFHPSHRREFVMKNDSLDRKGLDAQNLPFRDDNFESLQLRNSMMLIGFQKAGSYLMSIPA